MAKRFTDTEKWDRPWFRKLPVEYKMLWSYITDKCDIAGIWYADFELASFLIGVEVTEGGALAHFSKQIRPLPGGSRWLIEDFAPFQYGTLTPTNNMHRSVISKLVSAGVAPCVALVAPQNSAPQEPLRSPSLGAKDKDKVKDKDRVKDSVMAFDAFWAAYPNKVNKKKALQSWERINPSLSLFDRIMAALENQKRSPAWVKDGGQFIPHPTTWLNGEKWEDIGVVAPTLPDPPENAAFKKLQAFEDATFGPASEVF